MKVSLSLHSYNPYFIKSVNDIKYLYESPDRHYDDYVGVFVRITYVI
jgi:hypothetical protein